jgi:ATP-dependent 26S proteasome regulatory subunit
MLAQILLAVARQIRFTLGIDLGVLTSVTLRIWGADLQAVVYNADLVAQEREQSALGIDYDISSGRGGAWCRRWRQLCLRDK